MKVELYTMERNLHRLKAEIEICVDVHTRLDPSAVIQFYTGVEQYRPLFYRRPDS